MHLRRAVLLFRRHSIALASVMLACAFGAADAQTSVPATANIYGAGHTVAPGPGGNGGGVLPVEVALPAGTGRWIQFSASGTIDYGACCPSNGPEGISVTGAVAAPLYGGLAGCDFSTRGRYLAGVFLDDTEPMDPAPSALVFTDGSFTDLSPDLRQIFFIGDGLTGTGTGDPQTFHIPDDATRLFLGFQDRCSTSPNVPGWYGDNSGSASVTMTLHPTAVFTPAPVPSQLLPTYPNPFARSTAITVVPRGAFQLSVYDATGAWVRTIARGDAGPEQTFRWDGTNDAGRRVSSGVYYLRLTTDAGHETRSMVLLR